MTDTIHLRRAPQLVSFCGKVSSIHSHNSWRDILHAFKASGLTRSRRDRPDGTILSEHPKGMGQGYEVMNAHTHGGLTIFNRAGQDCIEMSTFLSEYAELTGAI